MNNVFIGGIKTSKANKITNLKYSPYSETIRSVPENYWVASVENGKVVFNSWDGAVKGRINKAFVREWWTKNKPK